MAREKRKKKKSSQTNCEMSSQEMDSHGTTTNHGQNHASTDCTCLSKSQKRMRRLLCCVATETPYCPIHTSEGSTVKTKARKAEKVTTHQPSLSMGSGRWLIKKVTKGKKEEQIPNKPIESISATVCINPDEPPRLQMLCQQVLRVDGIEETTQANKDDDSSVQCESAIVTADVDVHHELGKNAAISHQELCRAVVAIADDKTTSVTDSKQDLAYDEEQNKKNDTEPDTYDITPEYDQHTVMSLKEMCEAAVIYSDDNKIDQTDDKEQDEANESELDNKHIHPKCDNTMVRSLTELCTKAISNVDDRNPIEVENKDKGNDDELDTKDTIPKCDTNNVMSLKEMCTSTVTTADGMTTSINDIETDQANDVKEATTDHLRRDKTPECEKTMALSLKELCLTAIRNTDDLNRDTTEITEERAHNKELDEINESKADITENNLECDKYAAKALKELCSAAIRNVNDMKTSCDDTELDLTSDKNQKEPNDSEPSSYDINPKSDNASMQFVKELCLEAIENADHVKTSISDTLEDQTGEKELKAVDDSTEEYSEINDQDYGKKQDKEYDTDADTVKISHEIDIAKSLKDLSTAAIRHVDDMKKGIHDTNQEQAYDQFKEESNDFERDNYEINPKYDNVSTMFPKELCIKAIRDADVKTGINDTEEDQAEGKIKDEAYDTKADTFEINPEHGKIIPMTLAELYKSEITNADMIAKDNAMKQEQANDTEQKQTDCEVRRKTNNMDTDLANKTGHYQRDIETKQGHVNDVEEQKYIPDTIIVKASETKQGHRYDVEEQKQANYSDTRQATDIKQRYGHDDIDQKTTKDTNMDNANIAEHEYDHGIEGQKKIYAINMDTSEETNQCHYDDKENQMNAKYIINKAIRSKERYNDEKDDQQQTYDTDLDKAYKDRQGSSNDIEGKKQINDTDETKANDEGDQVETEITYTDMVNKSKQVHDMDIEKKDLTNNTGMNKANRTKQAQVDYTNLERTKESKENKAKDQPNDSHQFQATETVADRGRNIKQDRATVNMNKTADTADIKADDVEKDNINDTKEESTTETASTSENDYQNVNADGYNPELFLPAETILQLMVDVYNERRFKTRKKHRNKVRMQCEINYRINMDQEISNDDVKEPADKEHIPRNSTEENIRKSEKYKIGQVDSNNGGNDNTDSDIDANRSTIPTAETGVGARPKKRNLANENMIQAALKKIQDEAAIQSGCVPRSKAATNIAASEAVGHVERHLGAEAKTYTEGEHEPKPEPKLLPESQTEKTKDTTSCIDTGSSNTEISHGTYRKRKQKRKKAKWY